MPQVATPASTKPNNAGPKSKNSSNKTPAKPRRSMKPRNNWRLWCRELGSDHFAKKSPSDVSGSWRRARKDLRSETMALVADVFSADTRFNACVAEKKHQG